MRMVLKCVTASHRPRTFVLQGLGFVRSFQACSHRHVVGPSRKALEINPVSKAFAFPCTNGRVPRHKKQQPTKTIRRTGYDFVLTGLSPEILFRLHPVFFCFPDLCRVFYCVEMNSGWDKQRGERVNAPVWWRAGKCVREF